MEHKEAQCKGCCVEERIQKIVREELAAHEERLKKAYTTLEKFPYYGLKIKT